ncbi:MAG: extensin family protein [Alphaproteobacteria bacterium]|nr:MAG: extensin family protein [Alphaproteobacteria bacterium]
MDCTAKEAMALALTWPYYVLSSRAARSDLPAMLMHLPALKLLAPLMLVMGVCDFAAAQSVPLPRPRPAASTVRPPLLAPADVEQPSSCRLRLTGDLAVAPSLSAIEGPGECGADDVVRLEAVVLANKRQIAINPPAVLRCTLAESIVEWVREDIASAARALEAPVKSIDNYSSYDCRGRNRIAGAKLSEHGKANALDIRSFKLANGAVIEPTDPHVAKDFRENLRKSTCSRFTTVLGPGSDGYHENHIHVDLAQRANGHRMCQWEVRDPDTEGTPGSAAVPLPRPRPGRGHG